MQTVLKALEPCVANITELQCLQCLGLPGTIPALISALVELQSLWALTSFLIRIEQSLLHFSFDKCWPCAPLSHIFKRSAFIYRDLSDNELDGTIPAAISALVELTLLCAHTSFNLF